MTLLHSPLLQEAGFNHGFGTSRTDPDEYPPDINILKQVHGERIIALSRRFESHRWKGESGRENQNLDVKSRNLPVQPFRFDEGDALVTDIPATAIGIRTADCLPVLVGDVRTGAAAAIHCGWRSLALGLAEKAILALLEITRSDPSSLVASLGPSIGPCCYEVGEEVREEFAGGGCGEGVFRESAKGLYLDLPSAARIQLEAAGLAADAIGKVGGCTSCDAETFWSWRARKDENRMVSWIRAEKPRVRPGDGWT